MAKEEKEYNVYIDKFEDEANRYVKFLLDNLEEKDKIINK